MRSTYAVGFLYLTLVGVVLAWDAVAGVLLPSPGCDLDGNASTAAKNWFCAVKSRCNRLEASEAVRRIPPPDDFGGYGYAATCLAMAGRIDAARSWLQKGATKEDRIAASSVMFEVSYPIALDGDNVAAGPMMALVVEQQPDHHQALYYAGMSNYATDKPERARAQLESFLKLYDKDDFYGKNARGVLERIEAGKKAPPGSGSLGVP